MKKILFSLFAAAVLAACTNESATVKASNDSTTTTSETINLPYTVEKTSDWEIGNPAHVAVAMNTLKAYVDNDMTALRQHLADSVEFYTDNMSFTGSSDSLIKLFTGYRNRMDTINIRMQTYESVKSKGRGEEWVGLWYVETFSPKGGKLDSAMVMDDIQLVNGKVVVIDSKMRRLVKR